MATPAQIAANRLNALKSTGPSSVEGKAVSRFNALKHAATAKSLIIPGEDEAALAELAQSYYDHYQPSGPEEALLLEKIVAADWAQRRMFRLEAQVFNALIAQMDDSEANPLGAAFIQDCKGPNALRQIFRRREAASRDWYRAFKELRLLQAQRATPAPPPPSAPVRPAAPPPTPPQPETHAPRTAGHAPELRPQPPSPTLAPPPATPKIGFVLDDSMPLAWRL